MTDFKLIVTIVNSGFSTQVMDAAREAGAIVRLTQAFSPWEMMDADTEKALSEIEKIMASSKP